MLETILGPILGRSEEILTNQLYMRDTEDNTMYSTFLAYSIGMCANIYCIVMMCRVNLGTSIHLSIASL